MRATPPTRHRWTRDRYSACIAAGVFHPDDHIQLIEGDLIEMSPQNSPHAAAVRAATTALERIYAEGFDVRSQLPLSLSDESEPEPDVAVVRGHWRDYTRHHPTSAVLVVEIADSTLEFDRTRKLALYARAGVPEYWIVNLIDRIVEVYQAPQHERFEQVEVRRAGETMPASPQRPFAVQVDDLLP